MVTIKLFIAKKNTQATSWLLSIYATTSVLESCVRNHSSLSLQIHNLTHSLCYFHPTSQAPTQLKSYLHQFLHYVPPLINPPNQPPKTLPAHPFTGPLTLLNIHPLTHPVSFTTLSQPINLIDITSHPSTHPPIYKPSLLHPRRTQPSSPPNETLHLYRLPPTQPHIHPAYFTPIHTSAHSPFRVL